MDSNLRCPVCASLEMKRWAEKDGFQLYRCKRCTHLFADLHSLAVDYHDANGFRSHITNRLMASDEAYYQHLCEGEQPGSHTWITAHLILKAAARNAASGHTWLDVGSGSGYLLAEAQKLGFSVVGVEPGGWGQLAARQKKIRVIHGFLTPATFDKPFDVISATDVLEHQADPSAFLALLQHYLKVEGMLYLSFPFGGCWRARILKSQWKMIMPPTHCQFFTRKSLYHLASTAGLEVVAQKPFNTAGFPGGGRLGLSLARANHFMNTFGCGDQSLAVLRVKQTSKMAAALPRAVGHEPRLN